MTICRTKRRCNESVEGLSLFFAAASGDEPKRRRCGTEAGTWYGHLIGWSAVSRCALPSLATSDVSGDVSRERQRDLSGWLHSSTFGFFVVVSD